MRTKSKNLYNHFHTDSSLGMEVARINRLIVVHLLYDWYYYSLKTMVVLHKTYVKISKVYH